MSRMFGTDGVRGVANKELTPDLAFRLGLAGALVLAGECSHKPVILVGAMMPPLSGSAVRCSCEGRSRTLPICSQCARSVL